MKLMLILGQVRLSKGKLCLSGFGKRLSKGPAGLEPPTVVRNRKKPNKSILKILCLLH